MKENFPVRFEKSNLIISHFTHFHYVLSIGAVFGLFAGFTHWYPNFSGFTINPTWLKTHFFLIFIGVNTTFFPQHFLGLRGIPRRYSDYPDTYITWNVISSFGSLISLTATILFIFILWESMVAQRPVIAQSAGTTSPEWKIRLPLPFHSYKELIVGIDEVSNKFPFGPYYCGRTNALDLSLSHKGSPFCSNDINFNPQSSWLLITSYINSIFYSSRTKNFRIRTTPKRTEQSNICWTTTTTSRCTKAFLKGTDYSNPKE